MSMDPAAYLNVLLAKYAGHFDIYREHEVNGRKYTIYAYFSSLGEKYVLLKKAKLWSIKAYEHAFFVEEESLTAQMLDDAYREVVGYMEPVLVRGGEKYPEKDHMYTYLTFVYLCRKPPDEEVLKKAREFRFDKGYMFSMRGHSEVRIVVVDLDSERVYTNSAARSLRKMYEKAFQETKEGAKGYNELYEP